MIRQNPACLEALAAIETDPLDLPGPVEAHLRACPSCSEARVAWLAMEDAPLPQAPAGYFDHLPGRVLRKLPPRPRVGSHSTLLWALAAGLIAAVGAGGFLLGRANRTPVVEAQLAPATVEPAATLPENPFSMGDEDLNQLHKLSPEQAQAIFDRMETKAPQR
jgi:hypothetical protein